MVTHTTHQYKNCIYFVTFTCYKWLSLIEETQAYDTVYTWFHKIRAYTKILGYVIMPNHIHTLIYVKDKEKSLNQIVGRGKRFMAYEIVKRLKKQNRNELLDILQKGVSKNERRKRKKHCVFQLSFDAKLCKSEEEIETVLTYMHTNPVTKKWDLVDDFVNYKHSSAAFYLLGTPVLFDVTHYKCFF